MTRGASSINHFALACATNCKIKAKQIELKSDITLTHLTSRLTSSKHRAVSADFEKIKFFETKPNSPPFRSFSLVVDLQCSRAALSGSASHCFARHAKRCPCIADFSGSVIPAALHALDSAARGGKAGIQDLADSLAVSPSPTFTFAVSPSPSFELVPLTHMPGLAPAG